MYFAAIAWTASPRLFTAASRVLSAATPNIFSTAARNEVVSYEWLSTPEATNQESWNTGSRTALVDYTGSGWRRCVVPRATEHIVGNQDEGVFAVRAVLDCLDQVNQVLGTCVTSCLIVRSFGLCAGLSSLSCVAGSSKGWGSFSRLGSNYRAG